MSTTLISLAILVHVLAAVIWVGGMFFAYMALRPVAASLLEPPLRLQLWAKTFARFFPWVWISVISLPVSGYYMAYQTWQSMALFPLYVQIMQGIGIVMILIFMHVYFAPYRRLARCVERRDWPAGGRNLAQIRQLVGLNTILGLTLVAVASGGRFL